MATKRKQPKRLASPQKGDAFSWDVQPFQFMKDLRENYTQTVMQATQARSQTIAKEATRWMRQNASWQDQTSEARKGLRAYVMRFQEDKQGEDNLLAQARNRDKEILAERQESVKAKREAAREREIQLRSGYRRIVTRTGFVTYGINPDPVAADALAKRVKTQRQYRKPSRLPKSQSAVSAFRAGEAGRLYPLVAVKFTHNRELPYVIWLEIAKQGRYAIISRAIAQFRGVLFREIGQIASLKQYRDKIRPPTYQSDADAYQEHVDYYEEEKGRNYEPWSPERQRRRAKGRESYDSEYQKKYRAELKARNEKKSRPGTRTRQESVVERFGTVPTFQQGRRRNN